jgi:hypothetical protein
LDLDRARQAANQLRGNAFDISRKNELVITAHACCGVSGTVNAGS